MSDKTPMPVAGWISFIFGALAFILALLLFLTHIDDPKKYNVDLMGTNVILNVLQIFRLISAGLACISIIAGLTGFIRSEPWKPIASGLLLAAAAFAFFAPWIMLGLTIIVAVIALILLSLGIG